ncbi:hypothetical protein FVE85_0021 [Porphyridium purpureum]|uniref:Uncharacterized protein n=1 Tax=Porphyridium purpureum TaxID=35688 RepID=A0A5J4YZQ5_PORPP|nr:hypothetical protein FVE85_0021 [Porphyridium purpureum]|eukprot:POR0221..scf208_2
MPGFCVQMRTKDGRAVTTLDISPFISKLPFGCATNGFRTADASGTTSQAANIAEALGMGCELLIFDEDTCATNFMYRDAVMSVHVGKHKEKIDLRSLVPAGGSRVYVRDTGRIQFGSEEFGINLRALEQLAELGQTRLIADAMQYVEMASKQTAPMQGMRTLVARVEALLDGKGLDAVTPIAWKMHCLLLAVAPHRARGRDQLVAAFESVYRRVREGLDCA